MPKFEVSCLTTASETSRPAALENLCRTLCDDPLLLAAIIGDSDAHSAYILSYICIYIMDERNYSLWTTFRAPIYDWNGQKWDNRTQNCITAMQVSNCILRNLHNMLEYQIKCIHLCRMAVSCWMFICKHILTMSTKCIILSSTHSLIHFLFSHHSINIYKSSAVNCVTLH